MAIKILILILLNPLFFVIYGSFPSFDFQNEGAFLFPEKKSTAVSAKNVNYFSMLGVPPRQIGWGNVPSEKINLGSALLLPVEKEEKNEIPETGQSETAEKNAEISRASQPDAAEGHVRAAAPQIYPVRDFNVPDARIDARAFLLYDAERDLILYSKNTEEKMPIASLTKLMTAIVVLDYGKIDDVAAVSKAAVETEGVFGNLVVNEKISVKNLLHALLIESSNDAAAALAEYVAVLNPEKYAGKSADEYFVGLMNEKAKILGLKNTHFTTPSGLNGNYSTAVDLARLTKAAFNYPLIWEIARLPNAVVYSADGKTAHKLKNTNSLLGQFPNILGGKTGYTEEAGECMILVHEIKQGQKNIFVVLNSKDRADETLKLLQWSVEAFLW